MEQMSTSMAMVAVNEADYMPKAVCTICGESTATHGENDTPQGIICDDCYNERYTICDRCNITILADDAWCIDDKIFCESCKTLKTRECADCGDIHLKSSMIKTVSGRWICEDCYQDNYFTCEMCGYVFHNDDDGSDGYCASCCDRNNNDGYTSVYCDYTAYNTALKNMDKTPFIEFQNTWRNGFMAMVAEFYSIQLLRYMTTPLDGVNPAETVKVDPLTEERTIVDLASIFRSDKTDIFFFSPYWLGWTERMERREAQIIRSLETFFMRYIFVACLGEARHYPACSNHEYIVDWIPANTSSKGVGRTDLWSYAWYLCDKHIDDKDTFLSMCRDLHACFTENEWSSAYGGEKWANIISHLIRYLEGKLDKLLFVDQSISLVHNGSLFVDKLGVDIYSLKRLLDLKFKASVLDIDKVADYMGNDTLYHDAYYWACSQLGIVSNKKSIIITTPKKATPTATIFDDTITTTSAEFDLISLPSELYAYIREQANKAEVKLNSNYKKGCNCPSCKFIEEMTIKYHSEQVEWIHSDNICGKPCAECLSITCGAHGSKLMKLVGINAGEHKHGKPVKHMLSVGLTQYNPIDVSGFVLPVTSSSQETING